MLDSGLFRVVLRLLRIAILYQMETKHRKEDNLSPFGDMINYCPCFGEWQQHLVVISWLPWSTFSISSSSVYEGSCRDTRLSHFEPVLTENREAKQGQVIQSYLWNSLPSWGHRRRSFKGYKVQRVHWRWKFSTWRWRSTVVQLLLPGGSGVSARNGLMEEHPEVVVHCSCNASGRDLSMFDVTVSISCNLLRGRRIWSCTWLEPWYWHAFVRYKS